MSRRGLARPRPIGWGLVRPGVVERGLVSPGVAPAWRGPVWSETVTRRKASGPAHSHPASIFRAHPRPA